MVKHTHKSNEYPDKITLSDDDLVVQLKSFVGNERRLLVEILRYLREAEDRRLFLARGHSSLFDFCCDELQYSRSEAYTRIQAMRLVRTVPDAENNLANGELSLTVAASAQSAIRREEKKTRQFLPTVEKTDVVKQLLNVSSRDAEHKLATRFPESHVVRESIRQVSEELTKIEFMANQSLREKLEKLRGLLAHKNYEGRLNVMFEQIADIALAKLDPDGFAPERDVLNVEGDSEVSARTGRTQLQKRRACRGFRDQTPDAPVLTAPELEAAKLIEVEELSSEGFGPSPCNRTSPPKNSSDQGSTSKKRSRYIQMQIKRAVWKKAKGRCEFQDPQTGRRCSSHHGLQIDHIHEFSRGGTHQQENLRLLCGSHNRWRNSLSPQDSA